MKKKITMLVVGAIVLAGVAITAFAVPYARNHAWGGGNRMGRGGAMGEGMLNNQGLGILALVRHIDNPRVKTELGLTDAQVTDIKARAKTAMDTARSQRESLKSARKQLGDLMNADKPDANLIDGKLDEIGRMQTALIKQIAHAEIDIKNILTPDQLQKLKDFVAKRKEGRGMRGWGGNRGMGGPGGAPDAPGANGPSTGK